MDEISLRPASRDDEDFALRVTEACMRRYAERTWGRWNGRSDLDPAHDEVIALQGRDIGLVGVDREPHCWFLSKLYVLPPWQNRGIGGVVLERLIDEAKSARMALRLTVLKVNPARRFYERHGFVVTETITPYHYMEWRGQGRSRRPLPER